MTLLALLMLTVPGVWLCLVWLVVQARRIEGDQ